MGLLTRIWRNTPRLSTDELCVEPFSYRAWKWLWQRRAAVGWRSDLFERVAETDWDLLIILDACRYDTLADVADCAVIDRARSPASATPSFLNRARERGVFGGTVYVSANPQTDKHSPGDSVEHVPVYRDGWDGGLQTVPPSVVYEKARERLEKGDRVVAHTLQPHYPHICVLGERTVPVPNGLHPHELDFPTDEELKPQILLAGGMIDLKRARRSYEISVRFAWDRAKETAGSLAGEGYTVAVTADHGELFGEWGFVEHPVGVNLDALISVPWVVFRPMFHGVEGADGRAVGDQLAALGYAEPDE